MNIFQYFSMWFKRKKPWQFETIDRAGAADLLDSFAQRKYCSGEYEFFDLYLRNDFSDPLLSEISKEFWRIQDEFEASGGSHISENNLALLKQMSARLRSAGLADH